MHDTKNGCLEGRLYYTLEKSGKTFWNPNSCGLFFPFSLKEKKKVRISEVL